MGDAVHKIARRMLRAHGFKGDLDAMRTTDGPAVGSDARLARGVHAGTYFNGMCTVSPDGDITFHRDMYFDDVLAVLAAIAAQWPSAVYAGAPEEVGEAVACLRKCLTAFDNAALRKHGYARSSVEREVKWPAPE